MNYMKEYIKEVHLLEIQKTIDNIKSMSVTNLILDIILLFCLLGILCLLLKVYSSKTIS